jgi:hypothetical protein
MAQVPFGEWRPDAAAIDAQVLKVARNALPNDAGWGPMPGIQELGSDVLPENCLGACFVTKSSGSFRIFAGGTTDLYELLAGEWEIVSRAADPYATTAGNKWFFFRWRTSLFALNGADEPQVIDIESGTDFDDLGGSPPIAWAGAAIENYIFLMDATDRTRMVVNDFDDVEGWTLGTGTCDEFFAESGGTFASPPLLGTDGLILQTGGEAKRLVLNRGFERPWTLASIKDVQGAVWGYGAVGTDIGALYVAEDGIYAMTAEGQNLKLGEGRVNKWFLDSIDTTRINEVLAVKDPYSPRVIFAFHTAEANNAYDAFLGFDIQRGRFFYGEQDVAFWCQIVSAGLTLEQVGALYPNIDDMPVSLDSRQFMGGRPTIGGVSVNGILCFLTGNALEATFQTPKMQLAPGARTLVKEAFVVGVLGDADPTLRITRAEHEGDTETVKGPFTRSSITGVYRDIRTGGRIHQFELTIPADASWEFLQALSTTEQLDGDR